MTMLVLVRSRYSTFEGRTMTVIRLDDKEVMTRPAPELVVRRANDVVFSLMELLSDKLAIAAESMAIERSEQSAKNELGMAIHDVLARAYEAGWNHGVEYIHSMEGVGGEGNAD